MPGWLTSPEWENVVKALLHTLWQGAAMAVMLGLALRRVTNPATRYRCALGALVAVLVGGLVTWAVLCRPLPQTNAAAPAMAAAPIAALPVVVSPDPVLPSLIVKTSPLESKPFNPNWISWLALLWLAGATLMLARGGIQIAGAERLRLSSRPLEDPRLAALLAEARNAIGLARWVRLAVSEKLTSPVVAGVLMPTLILPVSLATSLAPEQIRFILLHELAHIRRGDYLANLFQLFAEALLFFNPAVWWISRQVRVEREACCDALAVQLSGAPADYARTLVQVVEQAISPAPAAAAAFGGEREPSSLTDRVQRMLVPGYRPSLKLTWRAMIAALLTGGVLLFASALGTRVTIAAILSPQQRIDRIEKKMAEYGQSPKENNYASNDEHAPEVNLSGHIRMADGSPIPKWISLRIHSTVPHSSYGMATMAKDGTFSETIRAGTITIGAETASFAPAILGPLDGFATNRFENLEIVMERGYEAHLQIVDADSGMLLTNGTVATQFWTSSQGFESHPATPGPDGSIRLEHCADLPLNVTVNVPGYEIVQRRFDHVLASEPLLIAVRHGEAVSGTVVDLTGQPVADAELHLMYQAGGDNGGRFDWKDNLHRLGRTDASGVFRLNQLQPGLRYYLGVSAPGHESVILPPMSAGASNLAVHLGPELIVRGQITGNLEELRLYGPDRVLDINSSEVYGNDSYGDSLIVPIHRTNGAATFQFTNRTAGHITVSSGSYREERDITAPVENWAINLTAEPTSNAEPPVKRVVIFHFVHPSSVPPRGSVDVLVPAGSPGTMMSQEISVTNDNLRLELPVGFQTQINPGHMVGYWFAGNQHFITVAAGMDPQVIEIPLLPAGAIYARARNVDGTPAGGLLFGVSELKRAPGRRDMDLLDTDSDSLSDDSPRKWASGPLPLGGTYRIHGWRGNAFCVSEPIKLTESNPDAEIELHFPPEKTFNGIVLDADARPVHDAEVKPMFALSDSHSFGLKSVYTDEHGRFQLENTTPDAGAYSVEIDAPGLAAESTTLNYKSQPQTIHLKRGRILAGRVVETGTGYAIPEIQVRAWSMNPSLPAQNTHTDADGHFEFNTLGNGEYSLYLDEAQRLSDPKYRADGTTNLVLEVKLYPWSKVKPKVAGDHSGTIEPVPSHSPKSSSKPATIANQAGARLPAEIKNSGAPRLVDPHGDVTRVVSNWSDSLPPNISPGRRAIVEKLDRIHLDKVAFDGLPLGEVLRQVSEQCRLRDPDRKGINFLINNNSTLPDQPSNAIPGGVGFFPDNIDPTTGLPSLSTAVPADNKTVDVGATIITIPSLVDVRLADVLDAIVLVADLDHPIKYSIQDFAVVFSAKEPETPQLHMRTFRVDPNTFSNGLKNVRTQSFNAFQNSDATVDGGGRQQNHDGPTFFPPQAPVATPSAQARAFFTTLGVNFLNPPGKSVFFNDKLGYLFVKATDDDLDTIERALQVLNQAPPQIHLKAHIFEMPKDAASEFVSDIRPTSAAAAEKLTGILTDPNFRTVLRELSSRKDVKLLAEPEVTVASGRQTQFRGTTEKEDVVNDVVVSKPPGTGPHLDVVPYVLVDGYTINLALVRADPNQHPGNQPPEITAPISAVRNLVTSLNVWDGQTIFLAGLPEPTNNKSSSVSGRQELVMFVTATIVDPAGARVHSDDQMPFALNQTPPQPPERDDHEEGFFDPVPGLRVATKGQERSQLLTRSFKVDRNTLYRGLRQAGDWGIDAPPPDPSVETMPNAGAADPTTSALVRRFLGQLGVDLNNPPGKAVSFDPTAGYLRVRATEADLDTMQQAIQAASPTNLSVYITARFIAIPKPSYSRALNLLNTTNPSNATPLAILSRKDARIVLAKLQSLKGVKTTRAFDVAVTSGESTDMLVSGPAVLAISGLEFVSALEAIPRVLADGCTINLALIPRWLTEAGGNGQLPSLAATGNTNVVSLPTVSSKPSAHRVITAPNIRDGQTVVLGGAESHASPEGEDVLVFVTPVLVDHSGVPVNSTADLLDLPPLPQQYY